MSDFISYDVFAQSPLFGDRQAASPMPAPSMPGEINGSTPLDDLPLTMAYVPFQKFTDLYEPQQALSAGTLFKQLDKPFLRGAGGVKNG